MASSGENIRSSGEPGKGESGRLMVNGGDITVCGQYSMLYGTGAASETERWQNRDQSQQRFCTLGQILSKKQYKYKYKYKYACKPSDKSSYPVTVSILYCIDCVDNVATMLLKTCYLQV